MTNNEIDLRDALMSVSKKRQFGPCWCDTLAGTYCVGQEQCKEAKRVMADSGKLDKLVIQRHWSITGFKVVCDGTNNTPDVVDRNELHATVLPRKHIGSIRLLLNNQEIGSYDTNGFEFISESEGIMAVIENVATRIGLVFGVAIAVEDLGALEREFLSAYLEDENERS